MFPSLFHPYVSQSRWRLVFDTRKNMQVAILLCNIELIFENALYKRSCYSPAVGCSVSKNMYVYANISIVDIVPFR